MERIHENMHVFVLSMDSDNSTVHLTLENQGNIPTDW